MSSEVKGSRSQCPKSSRLHCPRINSFPHTDTFWHLRGRQIQQTLWRKEKLPIMSNFSSLLGFARYPLLSGFSVCLSVQLFVKRRSTAQTDGPILLKLGEHCARLSSVGKDPQPRRIPRRLPACHNIFFSPEVLYIHFLSPWWFQSCLLQIRCMLGRVNSVAELRIFLFFSSSRDKGHVQCKWPNFLVHDTLSAQDICAYQLWYM